MKIKSFLRSAAAAAASLALIIAIIILSVRIVCFDRNIYKNEYTKNFTAWFMDTTDGELMKATDALLDYIKGDRDSIMVDVEIDGETVPFYNEREAAHMVDVKVLYQNAITVMWICFGVFVALTALQFVKTDKKYALKKIINGFFAANIIALVVIGALALFLLIDFDTFWTQFHHVFFTNDLWQLDMFTDRMIQMFAGGDFFFTICVGVVLWSAAIDLVLLVAAFLTKRKLGK